jgi:Trehalase-like, N-terminal
LTERYQPIEDYGIIGDLHTVALVGRNGSIDFLSFPRFDSPTIFARLLDHDRGGHFSIRPCLERGVRKQLYLSDTNILLSRFLSQDGVAEVSDFMPVGVFPPDHPRMLVRRVKTAGARSHSMSSSHPASTTHVLSTPSSGATATSCSRRRAQTRPPSGFAPRSR